MLLPSIHMISYYDVLTRRFYDPFLFFFAYIELSCNKGKK
nr:MAG TPA: hypothetical protein [Caudoviricetes sp.]